jgi:Ca-activated chloride channel family protein
MPRVKVAGRERTDAPLIRRFHERFQWPLGFAIVLLLAELFIPDRKLARRPASPFPANAQPQLSQIATMIFLGLALNAQAASPTQAQKYYETGNYQKAMREYQRLAERNPKDTRLTYNAGVAAYQAQEYEEAAHHFDDALRATDVTLQQRAYYNLGNSLFRLGQQEQELDKRSGMWESAIKHYDSALKLDPKDAAAKYNSETIAGRAQKTTAAERTTKKGSR